MLCRKPRSLIQANNAKATTKTAKYQAVMRARRGSFMAGLRGRENIRNRAWCESILWARYHRSSGEGGEKRSPEYFIRCFPTAPIRHLEWHGEWRHVLRGA